jgi:hypothetical protein
MCGGDHGRCAIYNGVTDRKQGGKLFTGERFPFWVHGMNMDRPGNSACSILLKLENKGRLIWRRL